MLAQRIQDLCFELGYFDLRYLDWYDLASRGAPQLLLNHLKLFVKDRPSSESVESLSAAYLATKPAGLKHEPLYNYYHPDRELAGLLSWPRDQSTFVYTSES